MEHEHQWPPWLSTLQEHHPLHRIHKELEKMATSITALKEAVADLAVDVEAKATLIKEKDAKITELESSQGGEGPSQNEIDEVTSSVQSSDQKLKELS
jgi:predicted  nucleic acid-binding Zn-ribbon protein